MIQPTSQRMATALAIVHRPAADHSIDGLSGANKRQWNRRRIDRHKSGRLGHRRRGATALETAIVLMVFLTLVFGMLEFGLAVFRSNIVSQAARQAARLAIVRGEYAEPELKAWGPTTYNSPATATDEIALAVRPYLAGLDLDRTNVQMEWIDGNHEVESRVRVTVTTQHDAFLTFMFTNQWTFRGVSVMPIAH